MIEEDPWDRDRLTVEVLESFVGYVQSTDRYPTKDDVGDEETIRCLEHAILAVKGRLGARLFWGDRQPPYGSVVASPDGTRWKRTGDTPNAAWEQADVDYFEPESWTRVCEAGPVRVVEWGDD